MANFGEEYKKLIVKEGGYVNDPNDVGGETYKGVSRKYNPDWRGWGIIDIVKKDHPKDFKGYLNRNPELEKAVYDLYKNRYWDCFDLDEIPNQRVAGIMFDTCVNQGANAAIKFAERSLGLRETGVWKLDLFHKLVALK